jgi:hypothetical protein
MVDGRSSLPRHVRHMRDHFASHPDWTPGRRYYSWFLTFEGQHELHRLAASYQAHLRVPNLRLVPIEWLHLTVQGVGDVDEVPEQDARAIAARAAEYCAQLERCELKVGPAHVAAEAIMLAVNPRSP